MSKVAAVIVTHNRKEMLLDCIEAVRSQKGGYLPEVIVVDNNSSDGTGEAVERLRGSLAGNGTVQDQEEATLHYFNLHYNSGGAGGFCYGLRKAAELGCDYAWLMDDDCVPEDDALAEMMDFASVHEGRFGWLSSRVNWTDGSIAEMNRQRETVFRDLKLPGEMEPRNTKADGGDRRRLKGDGSENKAVRAEMASFVSLLIPISVVQKAGLPIREFFIWTDDWEYTRRISREYPCYVIPSSIVTHRTAKNVGADISSAPDGMIDRFRYLYRNDVYLYRREGIRGFCYETVRLGAHLARIALSGNTLRSKVRRAGILLGGTADGLGFHPVPERLPAHAGDPE